MGKAWYTVENPGEKDGDKMGKNKSAYESYRTGLWSLIGVCAVTAVNYILAVFGMTLYFPFSAYIPREIIVRWGSGSGAAMIFMSSAALLLCYLVCVILAMRNSKLPCMKLAFALYVIDSGVYLVLVIPEIGRNGFNMMSAIEVLFRVYILYALYQADKVYFNPERKNPNAKPLEPPKKERPTPEDFDDDEDDEGIQW